MRRALGAVNAQLHAQPAGAVARRGAAPGRRAAFEQLLAEHFEQALALQPELVIFGSGPRLRFVAPALLRCLIERRIGVETMDTAAACRTYNVLASEGRAVRGRAAARAAGVPLPA